MKNRWLKSLISSSISIVPIIAIVFVLSLTGLTPLNFLRGDYILLFTGMVVLILGLSTFQVGASSSLTKVGEYMGSSLSKQKNIFIVILFSFTLGALITVAEPSILIITKQVSSINGALLIGSIAVGVGIFVVLGVLRIVLHRSLKLWYLFFYALTFMILILVMLSPQKSIFLPFIFDAGGVTTGSATVPFILSLGAGIAVVRGGKNAQNDSFGVVGMASIGPILTVTLLMLLSNPSGQFDPTQTYFNLDGQTSVNTFELFFKTLLPFDGHLGSMIEVLIALAPTLTIFLIYNALFIKLPSRKIKQLLVGFLFTFVGLSIFLCAATACMTPIGFYVGSHLGELNPTIVILFAFMIGLVTILCEPAVHVLTSQMEEMSDGRIKKITVLLTLSIGVGVAIMLSAIRTIFDFSIMYYMVPGYIIAIILMFTCPDLYVAMAFDSGGTASGPMSSSFVLPLIVGVTLAVHDTAANFYEQSFGVVAMIALAPVIAIQLLGTIERCKMLHSTYIMRKQVFAADDAQIINF